ARRVAHQLHPGSPGDGLAGPPPRDLRNPRERVVIGSVTQVQQEALAAEKRRRKKDRPERTGNDPASEVPPAVTGAHDMAEGRRDAMEAAEPARKAYRDVGAHQGPGHRMQPGTVAPEQFSRPYMDQGHAADSPQAGPPTANPMPPRPPGVLTPIVLPGTPMAARIPPHVAANLTMGSPSDR